MKRLYSSMALIALMAFTFSGRGGQDAMAEALPLSQQQGNALYLNSSGGDTASGSIGVSNPGSGMVLRDATGIDWVIQPRPDGTSKWTQKNKMPVATSPLMDDVDQWNITGKKGAWTFTRTTTAMYRDGSGNWNQAAANAPRFTFTNQSSVSGFKWTKTGYLGEGQVTNYALNSGTPASQTVTLSTAQKYRLWVEGAGSCQIAAGTATGTGWGTATSANPVTVDVTAGGTAILTVSGSLTRFQLENKDFSTSYIPTTTVPVTRGADKLELPSSGMTLASAGTVYAEVTLEGATAGVQPATRNIAAFSSGPYLLGINGSQFRAYDGTNVVTRGITWTKDKTFKVATTWSGSSMTVYDLANGTSTSGPYNGGFNGSTLRVCGNPGGEGCVSVRRVLFFDYALTQTELNSL